ncbi:hypothetical protein DFO45_0825 [Azorhizobium sp. AG788]|uniref:hypothetical protein n=1 Tax=Azorhizobium sp. AG788 TaxID=2183897 RepID=UPI00105FE6A6|nr:hypothetical protein [Azorhizobium sp. AG788]TDT99120.1 hypothetical protein DFO45_0825 [Azorhizobium sp. AG788]
MPALQIDGIKIATISTELAVRLREALDVPYVQAVRFDLGEAQVMSKPIPAVQGTVMTASSVRMTVTLTIEAFSGISVAQAAK